MVKREKKRENSVFFCCATSLEFRRRVLLFVVFHTAAPLSSLASFAYPFDPFSFWLRNGVVFCQEREREEEFSKGEEKIQKRAGE